MTEKRGYTLYLYSSWFLILSMVGFLILGVMILIVFQGILDIPAWIQYILLTLWLGADFLFSSFTAAKPVQIDLNESGLSFDNNQQTTTISWKDIQSYTFSDEIFMNSLKIKLENREILSIIDFKWRGEKEIYGFLQGLHHHSEEKVESNPETGNKVKSFFQNNLKTILGIVFFMVYVNISINLDDQGAFYTWNPIILYFYWVVPVFIFFKLVFAK